MMLQNSLNIISDIECKQKLTILVSDISMLGLFDSSSNLYKIGIYCQTNSEVFIIKNYKKNAIPFLFFSNLKNTQFDVIISHDLDFIINALKYTDAKYVYCSNKCSIPGYKLNRIKYQGNWFVKNSSVILPSTIISNNVVNTSARIIKMKPLTVSEKPKVFIIIPVYNQADFTVKCLNSISKYAEEKYEITCVIVDNGSNKENKDKVNECVSDIKNISIEILEYDKPLGYVKATNAGIKYALDNQAEYICLQNNDTEVTKNWMSLLIAPIKDQVVGSGPTTNSPLAIQGFSKLRSVLKDLPINIETFSTEKATETLQRLYKNKVIPITWQSRPFTPAFFCTMFRADIFNKFLLDECYGNGYADDIDYCFRIMQRGINLAYVPAAYVLHNHRTTFSSVMSEIEIKNVIKSRLYQCCNIVNVLNPYEEKKGVIYTAITGKYDSLPEHSVYNLKDYDYVCFTTIDNIINIKKPWKAIAIEPLMHIIPTTDQVKIARWFKTHPHLFFRNYKMSIWIDGSIKFTKDPNKYITDNKFDMLLIPSHPKRICIYQEALACIAMKKDTKENIDKEIDFLKKESYPKDNGLVQSNIIVRYHNKKECIDLMESWWNMIQNFSKRDQLSFDYVCWKTKIKTTRIPWTTVEKYIIWGHHIKGK